MSSHPLKYGTDVFVVWFSYVGLDQGSGFGGFASASYFSFEPLGATLWPKR